MLRCAASFVIAAYAEVRLNPQDLRALPAELFTSSSNPGRRYLPGGFPFIKLGTPLRAGFTHRRLCPGRLDIFGRTGYIKIDFFTTALKAEP
jgi:hypothetical protein